MHYHTGMRKKNRRQGENNRYSGDAEREKTVGGRKARALQRANYRRVGNRHRRRGKEESWTVGEKRVHGRELMIAEQKRCRRRKEGKSRINSRKKQN